MSAKNHGLDLARNHHTGKNQRILILGSTGRTGKAVIAELEQTPRSHQAVRASRNQEQVDAWRREGKDAVYLDLIEGSGVSWSHIHPHFFMDNLLTTTPVVNGTFHWFMGDKRVGWIAGDDLAAVSARVLAEGPEKHAGKQYWLSTEVLNGAEAAAEIARALQQKVECVVMTPDDLVGLIASGAVKPPQNIEANYAASMVEMVRQTYDGRLDFFAVTTTTVEDLLVRKPMTLRAWVARNSKAVSEAGERAAGGARAPTTH